MEGELVCPKCYLYPPMVHHIANKAGAAIQLKKICLRVNNEPARTETEQGYHENTTKAAAENFFLKILNCRDQLSKVGTVFLYLFLQYSQEDTKQVSSSNLCLPIKESFYSPEPSKKMTEKITENA